MFLSVVLNTLDAGTKQFVFLEESSEGYFNWKRCSSCCESMLLKILSFPFHFVHILVMPLTFYYRRTPYPSCGQLRNDWRRQKRNNTEYVMWLLCSVLWNWVSKFWWFYHLKAEEDAARLRAELTSLQQQTTINPFGSIPSENKSDEQILAMEKEIVDLKSVLQVTLVSWPYYLSWYKISSYNYLNVFICCSKSQCWDNKNNIN